MNRGKNAGFGYLSVLAMMLFFGSPVPAGSSGWVVTPATQSEDADTVMVRSIVINATQSLLNDVESRRMVAVAMHNVTGSSACDGSHSVAGVVPQTRGCIDWSKLSVEDNYIATAVFGSIQTQLEIGVEMDVVDGNVQISTRQLMGWIQSAIETTQGQPTSLDV